MTLFTRLGRWFCADLNAVLDGLEEPAALLKQALREMEEILAGEDAEQGQLDAEKKRLAQAINGSASRTTQLDDELSLCLDAGKDELARGLVRRKLEAANHTSELLKRQQDLHERQALIASRALEHRQRLDTLRVQAALIGGTVHSLDAHVCTTWAPPTAVSEAEIEVALLREKQRRAPA